MNSSTDRNIIKFYLGEETRPVIDIIDNSESHTIFEVQIKKALNLIKEKIIAFNDTKKSTTNNVIDHNYSNNIISFIGERGSGKTSCMYSVLENIKNDRLFDSNEIQTIRRNEIKILQPLDPSFFDSTHNILEVFIGEIFHDSVEYIKNSKEKDNNAHELIKKFQEVKHDMHYLDKETLFERDDELDELNYLSAGVNLERTIKELIDKYLELIRCKFLVISIDDIDLNTKQAYSMVEQIRKYLILPNVVILFAVKVDQLADVINNNLIGEFKNVLDKEMISKHDIYEMSEKYLNKFMPINNRIYLPTTEAIFEKRVQIHKYTEKGLENLKEWNSVKECVTQLIAEKCDYKFFNTKGKTSEIVPRNLRDLRLLISLLLSMNDEMLHNREIFKNYLFNSWINLLDLEEQVIARMVLNEKEPTLFNKTVVTLVFNHIMKGKIEINEDILKIIKPENVAYNVSLGDAFYVLNYCRDRETDIRMCRLLFFIKALYTIKLTDYYEELKNDSYNQDVNSSEILDKISNYEKLVGGNFFYLDGDRTIAKEKGKFEREIRIIDGAKLFEYITDIKKHYKDTKHLDDEKIPVLNAVEFFMLTISHYVRSKQKNIAIKETKDYRLDDDVYYKREITSNTKNLVFNFVSPFFSLIDIESTYNRFDSEIFNIAKNTKSSLYNELCINGKRPKFYSTLNSSEIIDALLFNIKQERDNSSKDNIVIFKNKYLSISKYLSRLSSENNDVFSSIKIFSTLFESENKIFLECFKEIYSNKNGLVAIFKAIMHYYGSFLAEYSTKKLSIRELSKILVDDKYFIPLKNDYKDISKVDIKRFATTYATVSELDEFSTKDAIAILTQFMLKYNITIQNDSTISEDELHGINNDSNENLD